MLVSSILFSRTQAVNQQLLEVRLKFQLESFGRNFSDPEIPVQ